MASSVYIETSIFSAHASARTDARSEAWREATREWWRAQREHYDCFVSEEVINELGAGDYTGREDAISMLADIRLLEINDEIRAISEVYVRETVMPAPPDKGDSLHMAIASYHGVDFLLTWNVRHLANPNKQDHLVVINRRLALLTPAIVTPDMLWWEGAQND